MSTSSITVVGHTITGVVHPSTAPAINRGATLATVPMAGDEKKPGNAPTAPTPVVTDPSTRTPAVAAPEGWSSTFP